MERGCSFKNFCFWVVVTLLLGLCCYSIYRVDVTGQNKNFDEVVTTIFHDVSSSKYMKDAYISSQKLKDGFR